MRIKGRHPIVLPLQVSLPLAVMLLPLMLLFTQCKKEKQEPLITITDTNFLNALIEMGYDMNQDSIINPTEAQAVFFLDISARDISDLSGIELFLNLEFLDCSDNHLTKLDVSNSIYLESLYCSNNQITGLDLTSNTDLEKVYCQNNQLTSLDLANLTDLHTLQCGGNQLTTLDLSGNQNLGLGVPSDCELDIGNMPALNEVCVWVLPFPPEGLTLCTDGSPNLIFTMECSNP